MTAPRQIKLGMFLRPAAHHIAGWRHKDAWADGGLNFAKYVETAKAAERGLFDLLFSADALTGERYDRETLSRTTYVAWIDPMSLLTALAPVTQNIGLVCTATTTYDEPYHIARRFASLDLISGGRSGWNLGDLGQRRRVRRISAARTICRRRCATGAPVSSSRWCAACGNSWDDDAFVFDKADGRFYDPDRRHVLDHAGEFFKVRGPLTVSRSPQGQPVVVQAGASDDGRQLAAETAEVVFCAHQSIDGAWQYYRDVKERMVRCGRDPDHLKVMPGLGVMVAPTRAEAEDKYQELQDLIHPEVGVALLSKYLFFDLRGYDIDGAVPEVKQSGQPSRSQLLSETARAEGLTIRQLYQRIAGGRGHFQVVGSTKDVADLMEEWFTTGAADGFNIIPPFFPNSLDEFNALVVPELQKRGLYRTAYEGKTLRENLGLPRPASRYMQGTAKREAAE